MFSKAPRKLKVEVLNEVEGMLSKAPRKLIFEVLNEVEVLSVSLILYQQ